MLKSPFASLSRTILLLIYFRLMFRFCNSWKMLENQRVLGGIKMEYGLMWFLKKRNSHRLAVGRNIYWRAFFNYPVQWIQQPLVKFTTIFHKKYMYACFQLNPKNGGLRPFPWFNFCTFSKERPSSIKCPLECASRYEISFFRKNKHLQKIRDISIPDIYDLYRIDTGNLTIFNFLVTTQLKTEINY